MQAGPLFTIETIKYAHANYIFERVRQKLEDRSQFLSYISYDQQPSVYGMFVIGFLVFYVMLSLEHGKNYEAP